MGQFDIGSTTSLSLQLERVFGPYREHPAGIEYCEQLIRFSRFIPVHVRDDQGMQRDFNAAFLYGSHQVVPVIGLATKNSGK